MATPTPEFTSADLVSIDKSIKSGVLSVRFQDRTVTYQSVDAMLKVRAIILADLAEGSATPIIRQSRAYGDKGW